MCVRQEAHAGLSGDVRECVCVCVCVCVRVCVSARARECTKHLIRTEDVMNFL